MITDNTSYVICNMESKASSRDDVHESLAQLKMKSAFWTIDIIRLSNLSPPPPPQPLNNPSLPTCSDVGPVDEWLGPAATCEASMTPSNDSESIME
jgi:hypothetical protein